MHFFKRWQPYLLISVLLAFSMLISVLYTDAITMPNSNWSKEITLDTTLNIEDSSLYYNAYFDVITDNNQFIYADITNNKLHIKVYDPALKGLKYISYDVNIGTVNQMSLTKEASHYKILAATDDKILYQLLVPLDFSQAITTTKVVETYDDIVIKKNKALFQLNETLFAVSDMSIEEVVSDPQIELFDFDFNGQDEFYISAITFAKGKYFSTAYHYNFKSKKITRFDLENLRVQSSTVPIETKIFYNDGHVHTLFSLKNTKYGQNNNFYYTLDVLTFDIAKSTTFINASYAPHFNFVNYNDSIALIYSDQSFIGKTDLNSQENTFLNIQLSTSFDLSVIPLTNNQVTEQNAHFLRLDEHAYLFTNAYTNHTNTLQVSSTHPELIEMSQNLSAKKLSQLIFNGLTYIPASLMTLFVPFILLIFPVILVILPVAIIKMSWAEKNQNRMLVIALIAYHLSKVYYLWSNQSQLIINHVGIGAEPWHLANIGFLFLTGLFTSLVSLLCLKVYTNGKKQPYFINQFAFFYGVEIIQFLFYYVIFTIVFL
jgi:hypothetical protein